MTDSYSPTYAETYLTGPSGTEHADIEAARPIAGSLQLEFVPSSEWNRLAGEFTDIIPEQMASFNLGHWGEETLEFAIFRRNARLVGGAVLIVRTIPFTETGVAILKWGPICHRSGTDFDVNLYEDIIESLKDAYCRVRNFHLTIVPLAKPITAEKNQTSLCKLGFHEGERPAAPLRYLVNVGCAPETLLASLDQKWRYNLRKALKNKFEISVVDPETGLDAFLQLYSQMIERKKFLDASAIAALERIVRESSEETRPMIVLVSHEGKVTAGGVFHVAGNMASYMFGATDDRALKLKAGYALHWWVAELLCNRQHIDWYDLGGNDLDQGLHQFKKGFVGKSGHVLLSPPRYHFAQSISAKLAGFAAFQVRDGLSSVRRRLHKLKTKK